MHEFRWRLLWLSIPTLLLCLLLWPLLGLEYAFGTLAFAAIAYLIAHFYWLEKFALWLKQPELAAMPIGSGIWEDVFAALYQEIRRQTSSHTELTSALERFQHAASALPDGVVLLNNNDQIEWCNPPAEIQLGLNPAQDTGQPIGYLVRQTEFTSYLQAQDYAEPIKLNTLRNPDITLEIQLIPFGDKQKLLLCRDITPMEKIETMRRDFIANVSHELRTPLTVVGGFLETMEDMGSGIPENMRQYYKLMQEQTLRMRRLVEDLLTLSQLESNRTTPQEIEIDVPSLLGMLMTEGESLSSGRHSLKLEMDKNLNLNGAAEELHSAFGNLVSNAIRYTPEGGDITLKWSMRGDNAVFSVTDTGLGIEPEHISRLTERFYRVDRSRSRSTGGTGLGLSIVKHILTRHQAKLEIQSEIGKGSTFGAVFPAARVIRKNLIGT
ncbi:MAG: phosphate regulon sensor histidine kinase PhoR [Methylophilaceae bacterium]|jgi:two-component system phosphate regulon sensor histidine kinase PhoR|uniref:phosphate regulon sensor histidine kinase PhoR n=1 Tax=Methylobacillus sp. MM3 TaxID=1848039 RepID=UPI0007E284EB|nr:phosphate regulon sensor histidine kinase PhoR [Methylobacillus sp. MM3]OAJ70345.1 phosphate regulon sensor histidine kinase PhoR [Methylobacillus sp. MM3]